MCIDRPLVCTDRAIVDRECSKVVYAILRNIDRTAVHGDRAFVVAAAGFTRDRAAVNRYGRTALCSESEVVSLDAAGFHGYGCIRICPYALTCGNDLAVFVSGSIRDRQISVDIQTAACACNGLAIQIKRQRLICRELDICRQTAVISDHYDRVAGRSSSNSIIQIRIV